MKIKLLLMSACLIATVGCESTPEQKADEAPEVAQTIEAPQTADGAAAQGGVSGIALSSSAFANGGEIPSKFTCDGENISVPLSWSNLPEGTQSVAVVMHDPDTAKGTLYHWGIWAIPADLNQLAEGQPTSAEVALGGVTAFQSTNVGETFGYTGPCPPEGDDTHRYIFEIFALDHPGTTFTTPPSAQALLSELQADAQARGSLTGLYKRQK